MAAATGVWGVQMPWKRAPDIGGLGELTGGSADRGVVVGGKSFLPVALSPVALCYRSPPVALWGGVEGHMKARAFMAHAETVPSQRRKSEATVTAPSRPQPPRRGSLISEVSRAVAVLVRGRLRDELAAGYWRLGSHGGLRAAGDRRMAVGVRFRFSWGDTGMGTG